LLKKALTYTVMLLLAVLALAPFIWLLSTSLKASDENIFAYPPIWIPQHPTLENYTAVWKQVPMAAYFINSLVATLMSVVLNTVFSVLAAYPLARMEFKGKNTMFMVILATMMIPFQVIMIPLYLMVLKLNLVDSAGPLAAWTGLVIPFVVGGFGIFFVRQALVAVPKALEESAVLDGANSFKVLWHVLLPPIRPSLAALAVFTFMANWGEFLWPSILLSRPESLTLPVGLVYLQGAFSANWRLIASGTLLSVVPVLVFFLLLQRYFVAGTTEGAVKG